MNYIITAAGKGTRLIQSGIKPPKPLVIVDGLELIIWSLNSFNFKNEDKLFIVTLKKDRVKSFLSCKIQNLFPNIIINWLELDNTTDGQLITTIKAIHHFSIEGKIIIHNCDTTFSFNHKNLSDINSNYFGAIPYFCNSGENWSFIRTKKDSNLITEVKEKERISSKCSVGTYYFRDSNEFLEIAKKYFENKSKEINKEFYIAPIYEFAINLGMSIIALEVKNVRVFGTLEEICKSFKKRNIEILSENDFSAHQRKTLVVDIDGTICNSPVNKDYTKCEPIEEICSRLREENAKGTYIILYTSRNMRTFKGNIGLINKYTNPIILNWLKKYEIPYDEIYFSKPWGFGDLNYIDDKLLSLKEFKIN